MLVLWQRVFQKSRRYIHQIELWSVLSAGDCQVQLGDQAKVHVSGVAPKLKGAGDLRSQCLDLSVEIWITAWKVIRAAWAQRLQKRVRMTAANGVLGSGSDSPEWAKHYTVGRLGEECFRIVNLLIVLANMYLGLAMGVAADMGDLPGLGL